MNTCGLFILYIWLGINSNGNYKTTWEPSGEFVTAQACNNAIRQLNINPREAKCISKQ